MTASLVLVLRQSPDWANRTYADLEDTRAFCRMIGRPETLVIDLVRLWDAALAVPYFAVRARLKALCLRALDAVDGARSVGIGLLPDAFDENAWYAFTDDDDWFDPGLARELSGCDPRRWDAVCWGSARFGDGVALRPLDGFFYTNSYAVSGAYLAGDPARLAAVAQHHDAQPHFAGGGRVLRLGRHLSVTNKHPASTVVMERALGGTLDPDRLRASVQSWLEGTRGAAWPEGLGWAEPLGEATVDVVGRLLEPRRSP